MARVGPDQAVFRLRLNAEDASLLQRIADKAKLSRSDVIRTLIRNSAKRRWVQVQLFR